MSDTTTELESVQELLDADERARERAAKKAPRGFDPACLFLLKMNPLNLFDPAGPDGLWFRCKGCHELVRPAKRAKHHSKHQRAFAKGGAATYPATDTLIDSTNEEESNMATTTKRSRSSRNLGGASRAATKSGSAKVAAAKKTASASASASKTSAAKKTTATSSRTASQRAEAGKIVAAAAAELKGKSPMTAAALADLVCKKDSKLKPFNVAFAIRQAARKGETFKRSNDRPALYSLKG